MLKQIFTYTFFCAIIGYYGLLLFEGRRPLCIDSKVVDRIDRVAPNDSATLFACHLRQWSDNRHYFEDKIGELRSRIQGVENFLLEIEPFKHPVQIVFTQTQPWFFQVLNHRIYIGENLANEIGHLERGIIKVWLRERGISEFENKDLAEEIFADFIWYMISGRQTTEDPDLNHLHQPEFYKWPLVLKSAQDYCLSDVKSSEHYHLCKSLGKDFEASLNYRNLEISLRPMILQAWIEALKDLSLGDRYILETLMGQIVSGGSGITQTTDKEIGQTLLEYLSRVIFQFQKTALGNHRLSSSSAYALFAAKVNQHLNRLGVNDSGTYLRTDYLFIARDEISARKENIERWKSIAKEIPNRQIVFRGISETVLLPSGFSLNDSSVSEIKAGAIIVEHCGPVEIDSIEKYSKIAERLLLVENCDSLQAIDYLDYLRAGIENFAQNNRDVSFIHFHLPSLNLRKKTLPGKNDIVRMIEQRDHDSTLVEALGWKELEWKEGLKAYQPKAEVDAIQLFRVSRAGFL